MKQNKRPQQHECSQQSKQGDADEAPKVHEPLANERAESRASAGEIAVERSRNEQEVKKEIEQDGGVARERAGLAGAAFMETHRGSCSGAEIEARGEALGSERAVQQIRNLNLEGETERQGKREVEGVGPQK